MQHLIKKGNFYETPKRFGLVLFPDFIQRTVTFDDSAKYSIPAPLEINKIWGVRFFGDYSARFGWRYDGVTDKVELMAYVHDNGKVTKADDEVSLGFYKIGSKITTAIDFSIHGIYIFYVNGVMKSKVNKSHNQRIGFKQGFYFGGIYPAPHDITIDIK